MARQTSRRRRVAADVATAERAGKADLGKSIDDTANSVDKPATAPASMLRLNLIGPVRVRVDGSGDCTPPSRRARAILAYVARSPGARVPRARLAALLWERVPERQAKASLRQSLYEIGEVLPDSARSALVVERDTLTLDPALSWVDIAELEHGNGLACLSESGAGNGHAGCDQILEGLDGISESFDDWLTVERAQIGDRLRDRFAVLLEQARAQAAGTGERAALARSILDFDPCHEIASRTLMRALLEQGDAVAAVREYDRFRTILKSRLEAQPSRETSAIYEAVIRSGGDSLPAEPAAVSAGIALGPAIQLVPSPETPGAGPAIAGAARANGVASRPAIQTGTRIRLAIVPPTLVAADESSAAAAQAFRERLAGQLARFAVFDVVMIPEAPETLPAAAPWDLLLTGTLTISSAGSAYAPQIQLLDEGRHVVWTAEMVSKADPRSQQSGDLFRLYAAKVAQAVLAVLRRQIAQLPAAEIAADPRASLLMAQALTGRLERAAVVEAARLADGALERARNDASLLATAALVRRLLAESAWEGDPESGAERAQLLASDALAANNDHPDAHVVAGYLAGVGAGDFTGALEHLGQAIELNPGAHLAFAARALVRTLKGDDAGAVKDLRIVRVLGPNDPILPMFEISEIVQALRMRKFEDAFQVAARINRKKPGYPAPLKLMIPALIGLGNKERARQTLARLKVLEPAFTPVRFIRQYALEPAGLASLVQGAYAQLARA